MASAKLLKIDVNGVPVENATTDDITFNSYTVTGGPVLSSTGLNLNTTPITGLTNVTFVDPTTNTISQTAGTLIIDNIMAKDRSNAMTTASDILFPVVTNTSGQLDALRLPAVAGAPSATPTATGEGFMVWDSVNDDLYVWNGTAWDNQNLVKSSEAVDNLYTVAVTIAARDIVYISAADSVSPAKADVILTSEAIGFATTGGAVAATVAVRKDGLLTGFTGLVAGSRYYLDVTTAGAFTATLPTASGASIVLVGRGKNATTMDIKIQALGRRA